MTEPDGQTPAQPDNDTVDDGTHDGDGAGRTPSAPDVDQPDGGAHDGS